MTINNQYKKLNIAFLVIVAPFLHLARRRNKLSAVLLSGENNRYYTSGGQLQAMTISNGSTVTTTMQFYYNASGTPVAFKYNGTLYYYLTNLQGDVIGIIDDYGVSAYYVYDAWGKIISTNSASNTLYSLLMANPLRYRGLEKGEFKIIPPSYGIIPEIGFDID